MYYKLICILYALLCGQNFILVKSGCYRGVRHPDLLKHSIYLTTIQNVHRNKGIILPGAKTTQNPFSLCLHLRQNTIVMFHGNSPHSKQW
jgi:protein-S-isoprenylcysteine O-methyltransferase Ste14